MKKLASFTLSLALVIGILPAGFAQLSDQDISNIQNQLEQFKKEADEGSGNPVGEGQPAPAEQPAQQPATQPAQETPAPEPEPEPEKQAPAGELHSVTGKVQYDPGKKLFFMYELGTRDYWNLFSQQDDTIQKLYDLAYKTDNVTMATGVPSYSKAGYNSLSINGLGAGLYNVNEHDLVVEEGPHYLDEGYPETFQYHGILTLRPMLDGVPRTWINFTDSVGNETGEEDHIVYHMPTNFWKDIVRIGNETSLKFNAGLTYSGYLTRGFKGIEWKDGVRTPYYHMVEAIFAYERDPQLDPEPLRPAAPEVEPEPETTFSVPVSYSALVDRWELQFNPGGHDCCIKDLTGEYIRKGDEYWFNVSGDALYNFRGTIAADGTHSDSEDIGRAASFSNVDAKLKYTIGPGFDLEIGYESKNLPGGEGITWRATIPPEVQF